MDYKYWIKSWIKIILEFFFLASISFSNSSESYLIFIFKFFFHAMIIWTSASQFLISFTYWNNPKCQRSECPTSSSFSFCMNFAQIGWLYSNLTFSSIPLSQYSFLCDTFSIFLSASKGYNQQVHQKILLP